MGISNGERLLHIIDILIKETDENHKISKNDIEKKLSSRVFEPLTLSSPTINGDIRLLTEFKYGIITERSNHTSNLYYCGERLFETSELRLLIDAISTCKSISKRDVAQYVDRLKKLTSIYEGSKLKNSLVIDDVWVCEDPKLKYYINILHEAVQDNQCIQFKYGRYNTKKEFIINERQYIVGIYGLVWSNGFYYLVGKDIEKDKVVNYRVDRMRDVINIEKSFDRENFDLSEYLKRCFNMYTGEYGTLDIVFDNHLINAVIDRFGKDINITKYDENRFKLTIKAAISKGLIRWLLNWGSDAQVLYPPSVISQMKEEIEKMNKLYNV